MRTFLAAVAFTALAALAPVHAATSVPDGNFDSPAGSNPFTTYTNTPMGPWQVAGSIDLIGNYWQGPPSGGGSVDLSGNYPGGIFQIFPVNSGNYKVSFYMAGNTDGGEVIKSLRAYVIDSASVLSQFNFTFDTTGLSRTNMGWTLDSFNFNNPTNGPITLYFQDTTGSSPYGAAIGGINISAVPEPATWAMLILGFGGIGMMMRRRRDQVTLAV